MELKNWFFNDEIVLDNLGGGVTRKVIAHNDNIMIVEVNFEKGAVGSNHMHEHEQATYIISGEYEFNINGVSKIVKAGDSIYFQPNCDHGATCLKAGKIIDTFTPMRKDFLK